MAGENKAEPTELLIGTVIGDKYRVVKLLGLGGMGAVYEAVNTWTLRRVALKVLLPEASARPDLEQRFKREAHAIAALRHPNIVEVLDMGRDRDSGTLYMVQEFLEGTDLYNFSGPHGPFLAREALELIVPILGALIAAHECGILHRDIKPENIFLQKGKGGEKVPKLIDFGVAKILSGRRPTRQTEAGQVVGTVHYMSPEQARGEETVDVRSDIWALGVVLYEMLAGVLPFDAENVNVLVVKIMQGNATPLTELAPDLPPSLCALVHRALAVRPEDRFQSVREMLDAALACEIFAHDAPEKSIKLRHLRSLPTYNAQLRPATPALCLVPKAPNVPFGLSVLGVGSSLDEGFEGFAFDDTRPRMNVAGPEPIDPEARDSAERRRALSPASKARLSPMPRAISSRIRLSRNEARRTQQSMERKLKLLATGFLLVSLASLFLVWQTLQPVGHNAQLNASLVRINNLPR